ncbi:colicin D domain-containing protein [Aneurinibacillus aneurinilyticus]
MKGRQSLKKTVQAKKFTQSVKKATAAAKRKKLGSASVVKKKVSKKAPKAVGKKGTTRVQRKVGKVFTDARKLKNNLTVYERVKKLKKQMKQRMIVSVSVEANPVRVASAYSGSIFMPYTLTMDDAKKAVDWGINKAQPAINGLKNMKRKVDEKAKPLLPYVDMVLNVTGGGRGLPRGGGVKRTPNNVPKRKVNLPSTISYSNTQLQKKFKHASDFGVQGNYNTNNATKFKNVLNSHIKSADNIYQSKISGTGDVFVYIKDKNLAVFVDKNGNFVSGWRLNQQQLDFHTKHHGIKIK